VGLIARVIEEHGIPTVGISIVRQYTEKVKPPRTIYLNWPYGHPFGEPFHVDQQRSVLLKAIEALYEITDPGTIIDIPWRWKREKYRT